MYVCMYVCKDCMYVCMYVCIVCMYACIVCIHSIVCMYNVYIAEHPDLLGGLFALSLAVQDVAEQGDHPLVGRGHRRDLHQLPRGGLDMQARDTTATTTTTTTTTTTGTTTTTATATATTTIIATAAIIANICTYVRMNV